MGPPGVRGSSEATPCYFLLLEARSRPRGGEVKSGFVRPPPSISRRLPPLAHQDRQDHLQIRPRAAKMSPRGPKSNQEPPKSDPRAAEDHQIATQEPQRATKNHQIRVLAPARSTFSNMSVLIFRLHLQPPKSDPRGHRGVLRLHQSRPRPPKSDPSEPQDRSRSFQRAPYDILKSHQDPPRVP